MKTVSIHQAKAHFSSLITGVERSGEKIIIQRHGRAVAEVNQITHRNRLDVDPILKMVKVSGDLTAPISGMWDAE
jgi:antitoxin (DNA-binding transcriptional repressor) of toxin-antitoxin stability system